MTKELAITILDAILNSKDTMVENRTGSTTARNYVYTVNCTPTVFDAIEMAKEALENESER